MANVHFNFDTSPENKFRGWQALDKLYAPIEPNFPPVIRDKRITRLPAYGRMFSIAIDILHPPLFCMNESWYLGPAMGWFRSLGLPVDSAKVLASLDHQKVVVSRWALTIIDCEEFGGIDSVVGKFVDADLDEHPQTLLVCRATDYTLPSSTTLPFSIELLIFPFSLDEFEASVIRLLDKNVAS